MRSKRPQIKEVPGGWAAILSALRNCNFYALWVGQLISQIGDNSLQRLNGALWYLRRPDWRAGCLYSGRRHDHRRWRGRILYPPGSRKGGEKGHEAEQKPHPPFYLGAAKMTWSRGFVLSGQPNGFSRLFPPEGLGLRLDPKGSTPQAVLPDPFDLKLPTLPHSC